MQENNLIRNTPSEPKFKLMDLVWVTLLAAILVLGVHFRTIGMDWDDSEYLHPDERFMTFVVSAIHQNTEDVSFFNTEQSTMNPDNVGYDWYVYGTLPLFMNRIISDWLAKNSFDLQLFGRQMVGMNMYMVGRALSAIYDSLTILITFFIGLRLFKKIWPAVVGAGLYAFFALPIQLSHYFTVDIMANLLSMAAFYMAVRIMTRPLKKQNSIIAEAVSYPFLSLFLEWRGVLEFFFFGVFFGLAMACKISVLPVAALIVLAVFVQVMNLSDEKERLAFLPQLVRNLFIAGVVSILVFRIGQPYAFTGPTFFHMIPDRGWFEDLQGLSGQSKGLVDFPPALQWSRRPITFGWKNLTLWGVGLPLGIMAWAAYLWQGIQILRGKWREHLVVWGLITMFFVWQSLNFTSSMRYYLQIYVPLALVAVWGGFSLIEWLKRRKKKLVWVPALLIAVVFIGTLGYGYAFSRIYSRPATRVEASDWYLQNIPAPINVKIDTVEGEKQQVFGYEAGRVINQDNPAVIQFTAQKTTIITSAEFARIREAYVSVPKMTGITVSISSDPSGELMHGYGDTYSEFGWQNHQFGDPHHIVFTEPAHVVAGEVYYLRVSVLNEETHIQLTGSAGLRMMSWDTGEQGLQMLPEFVEQISAVRPKTYAINPKWTGEITRIEIPHIVDLTGNNAEKTLTVRLQSLNQPDEMTEASLSSSFSALSDIQGEAYIFTFDEPFRVEEGQLVQMEFSLAGSEGVAFFGTKQANESSWDDVVPLRRSGYDPFGANVGEYRSELNFEMYWEDNEDKRERFLTILEQADLIMITSSRQWGSTTRVPERYPMTTMYYRELIGCPADKDIFWCYAVAEPGMFSGDLGFELKAVFQSDPNIGEFKINDQFAEEAFKVYDHPKVLIFEKTDAYDREAVRDLFYAVDLSTVMHMIPADVPLQPRNLMLPEARWARQQEQGTWSVLYAMESLVNRSEFVALLVFYLFIGILGLAVYPITRIVFSGLANKGYAVSRLFGLLIFAWLCWMIGSAGIDVTQGTIWLVFLFLLVVNGVIFSFNREAILAEVRQGWKKYLRIEAIGLGFFLAFLFVRLGNPDLWHPYKGGEKPMDFSYLNAVLKSTTFPPYDPWFAGGYINYYYYGFVIIGMPIKALGIVPAVAYNLALAMLFSLFALVAYTIGATLSGLIIPVRDGGKDRSYVGGFSTVLLALVMGNFGTIQMISNGLVRLGGGGEATGIERLAAFINGIGLKLQGQLWPFYPGDWYWIPSRMIEGEPITEFPYFTFLYADLHAHLIAMPITLLVVAWCISILQNRMHWQGKFTWQKLCLTLFSGALIIGALRPTNTWDFPVFLVLAALTLAYTLITSVKWRFHQRFQYANHRALTIFVHLLLVITFVLTAVLLYSPFSYWYGEGYNAVRLWDGSRTRIGEYLSHWGIMLAIVTVWFTMDSVELLKHTPVSALRRLQKYQTLVILGISFLVVLLVSLTAMGVKIQWVALLLAVWAALLLVQKRISPVKRLVYFLMGTAMFLTVVVEVIVLEGDIGRMNTVFKFYLQAWNLLAIVAGVGLSAFLIQLIEKKPSPIKTSVATVLGIFLLCGAMFPIAATIDKVTDRMAMEAPHVLDGMAYMDFAEYSDQGQVYSLKEDADAIRWMQANVDGTPVIIEGNVPEYRWGNRFTIYTGLPSVVGWNWHQRQQRTYLETDAVQNRVNQVNQFYSTSSIEEARRFLIRYDVEYIIVGQMEELYCPETGLMKFAQLEGELWELVYSNTGTSIYRVLDWE